MTIPCIVNAVACYVNAVACYVNAVACYVNAVACYVNAVACYRITVEVKPIELDNIVANDNIGDRWDKANIHDFRGTYGDYVLNKVSKVFLELRRTVL